MAKKPRLVGTSGYFEGQKLVLDYGKTVVVGRSRSADLSLRRAPEVVELTDDERQESHDLRTVSGKHFEITPFSEDSIEIVNLSPNGTYVDGKRVDKIVLEDVAEEPHEIRIGSKEVLRLEISEDEDEGEGEGWDEAKGEGAGEKEGEKEGGEEGGEEAGKEAEKEAVKEGEDAEDSKEEIKEGAGDDAGSVESETSGSE